MTHASPVSIRPERADHPQVGPLLAALDDYLATLYAPEDNHILDVSALLQPEVDFLVATQGDRLVGCGATRRMPGEADTAGQAYGEIKRMYVAPEMRGQRIAEQLLAQLEARLLADGLTLATLETGRDQLQAVRLYERCGYQRRAPFGGYPDNGLSLFYEKRLALSAPVPA
ncbi:GNAT family N-acetyltransferase [Ideonella azotifigens]|uniref:GNAT family N-acetyltransferase n=1 Tax=Ideonella azotifigens TaxID=513160 RepID=A0ABN1K4D1_9BURK|nr:GNAT family N-acetyltransferase [Ideonella azotifigens]MCD2344306.1 GNAT family N-acetyltransferase [Ideonella azotifigens]